ncbi:mitochondrial inner membrane protein [Coccidioides immitis H538.4]|uniref:Mitochondrial inner membrane protein n=1 Tax=Coccidioides immitis H538.4 TaxID=396776 RepID=A0A0J8UG41_COCIT|nr:mitochondrial inner membrane protein [Coccidioides immitis H538.4]
MAQVKDALKASLVGTPEQETPMTAQVRANFMQHARTDTGTGELYMMEEDFINAIAPKQENYVRLLPKSQKSSDSHGILFLIMLLRSHVRG